MPYGGSVKTRALLVLAVTGAVLLSGCTAGGDRPSAANSAVASPTPILDTQATAALLAAMAKSVAGPYKMAIDMEMIPASGASQHVVMVASADLAAKKMLISVQSEGTTTQIRLIGNDVYITGLPQLGKKWMRVDASRIEGFAEAFSTGEQNLALLAGIVELTAGPGGKFQGSIDPQVALNRATTETQRASLAKLAKLAGEKARLPFTTTITDGYLVAMTTEYPIEQNKVVGKAAISMTLSDFGKPVAVLAPPAKDVVAAPSS